MATFSMKIFRAECSFWLEGHKHRAIPSGKSPCLTLIGLSKQARPRLELSWSLQYIEKFTIRQKFLAAPRRFKDEQGPQSGTGALQMLAVNLSEDIRIPFAVLAGAIF
jgi:hypothetical protein